MFEMLHVTYIMLRQIHKIINGKVIYCLVRFYANLLYCFHSWKTLIDIMYFLFHGKAIHFFFLEIRFYFVSRKSYIILIFFLVNR